MACSKLPEVPATSLVVRDAMTVRGARACQAPRHAAISTLLHPIHPSQAVGRMALLRLQPQGVLEPARRWVHPQGVLELARRRIHPQGVQELETVAQCRWRSRPRIKLGQHSYPPV